MLILKMMVLIQLLRYLDINVFDTNLEKFDDVVNNLKGSDDTRRSPALSYKVSDEFWKDCVPVFESVPYGHKGKAIFNIDLTEAHKAVKSSSMEEIDDGRNWSKKKIAIKYFEGCTDRKRWYQDCNGHFECVNESCSALRLFSKPFKLFVKDYKKFRDTENEKKCSSCNQTMTYFQCIDHSIQDKNGRSPQARRYLDFDWCHSILTVKYVGSHTCVVARKLAPMDEQFVQKYFTDNPSSTAARFKDFAIANAISEGKNVEEVSLQYADLTKIRQIMMKTKKVQDPDGTGTVYLQQFGESLGNQFNDPYLLTITENPRMFIISSKERMKTAGLMSDPTFVTNESCSIDFCESQFKEYSVMEVTTYSGELRQLVPMFQIVFRKPAENADNVAAALTKIDDLMMSYLGMKFEPLQWTTDNSGALENGIGTCSVF